jgi:hypothetical protein
VSLRFAFSSATSSGMQGQDQTFSAPAGVRVLSTEDEELVVIFPTAGAFPLSVSWTQDDGDTLCRATGQVPVQVLAATRSLTTFKKVLDIGVPWQGRFKQEFHRARGGDASPVRVLVRSSARGTLRPPTSGRVLLDKTVSMGANASHVPDDVRIRRRTPVFQALLFDTGAGYELGLEARLPPSKPPFRLKFAFTVELFQSGRRISAISTGMSCRDVSSGGHKTRRCVTVGFRKRTS